MPGLKPAIVYPLRRCFGLPMVSGVQIIMFSLMMLLIFFKDLYSNDVVPSGLNTFKGGFPLLSNEDYTMRARPVTNEEIQRAFFDMNPYKSPGIDGFQACFSKALEFGGIVCLQNGEGGI